MVKKKKKKAVTNARYSTKKTKSQIGKASRNKGKRGERMAADIFRKRGFKAKRGVQYRGGLNSPDINVEETDAFINHEVKNMVRVDVYKALEQSHVDAGPDRVGVVVYKCSRKPWLVAMSLFDYINILQELTNKRDSLNTLPNMKVLNTAGSNDL